MTNPAIESTMQSIKGIGGRFQLFQEKYESRDNNSLSCSMNASSSAQFDISVYVFNRSEAKS